MYWSRFADKKDTFFFFFCTRMHAHDPSHSKLRRKTQLMVRRRESSKDRRFIHYKTLKFFLFVLIQRILLFGFLIFFSPPLAMNFNEFRIYCPKPRRPIGIPELMSPPFFSVCFYRPPRNMCIIRRKWLLQLFSIVLSVD